MKVAGKAGARQGAKLGAKTLGKVAGKKLPFGLGLAVAGGLAAERFSRGDKIGGIVEILSGLAAIVPGVGTAASGTTGEIRATNDVTAFYSSDMVRRQAYFDRNGDSTKESEHSQRCGCRFRSSDF